MTWLLCGLAALGVLAGGAEEVKAEKPGYLFEKLDLRSANGINDSGQILESDSPTQFLYSGGLYTPARNPAPQGRWS
jgi:hypothetical protein